MDNSIPGSAEPEVFAARSEEMIHHFGHLEHRVPRRPSGTRIVPNLVSFIRVDHCDLERFPSDREHLLRNCEVKVRNCEQ